MSEIKNPYIAGAPIDQSALFFGRDDIFQWIENSLVGKHQDQVLVIHGQRRVGKTSVLKQLKNRLPEKYIPVFFDFQGHEKDTFEDFLWGLTREILRTLRQDQGVHLAVPRREQFQEDVGYFENSFLPLVKDKFPNQVLLICFDEFDTLEEAVVAGSSVGAVFQLIKRLFSDPFVTFIFSIGSSGRQLEYMKDRYTALFKTALYRKISFLSFPETERLITQPSKEILKFHPNAIETIFNLTSGHPYYIQLICFELFAQFQKTGNPSIEMKDVQGVLEDVVERGTVNLKFIWDESSPLEKISLVYLGNHESKIFSSQNGNKSVINRSTLSILEKTLRKEGVQFVDQELRTAVNHLVEKEVISANHSKFNIRLFPMWIRKNWPVERMMAEFSSHYSNQASGSSLNQIRKVPKYLSIAVPIILVFIIGFFANSTFIQKYFRGSQPPTEISTPTPSFNFNLTPTGTSTLTATVHATIASPTALTPTITLTPTPLHTPIPTATTVPKAGATQTWEKDGMVGVYVPAGEFLMGGTDSDPKSSRPQHLVYLDEYWIDQTEVTNGQYMKCVAANGCKKPSVESSLTRPKYYGVVQYIDYPVANVDWYMAKEYCAWAGRRLPTEAEWEKAARGTDQRPFPWGNTNPVPNLSNYNYLVGDTTPVGKYPLGVSIFGALDMAGNVAEWVEDIYDEKYYLSSPLKNPLGPANGENHVHRGGTFAFPPDWIRSGWRFNGPSGLSSNIIGFRCAR